MDGYTSWLLFDSGLKLSNLFLRNNLIRHDINELLGLFGLATAASSGKIGVVFLLLERVILGVGERILFVATQAL